MIDSFLASVESSQTPHMIGMYVGFMLFLFGAVQSYRMAARTHTHTLCVLSLGLLFSGFCVMRLGSILGAYSVVMVLCVLLGATIVFVAVILAIVGLFDYRHRGEAITKGKNQAIWTIVLGSLTLILIFVVMAKGFVDKVNAGEFKSFIDPSSESSDSLLGEDGSLQYPEFNLSFPAPESPWTRLKAESFVADARYGIRKRFPEIYLLVIPEIVGIDSGFSEESLREVAVSNLMSVELLTQTYLDSLTTTMGSSKVVFFRLMPISIIRMYTTSFGAEPTMGWLSK